MRGRIHRFLIAALCGSVAMLGACSSAPQQGASAGGPAPTSSAGTEFSWGDDLGQWAWATEFSWGDDLSRWVTEDEMTQLLVELLHQDGTAVLIREDSDEARNDWVWDFEDFRVVAHNGDHGGTGTGASSQSGEVVPLTKTDEALPEGVVFEPLWGFADGFYLLSGPLSKESLCMTVMYKPEWDNNQESTLTLAVAAMMLTEMGWATVAD